MAKKFLYRSYKTNFKSIPEVMIHMQELQEELQDTELANLRFFNITYFIITQNVFAKTHQDYFSDKDLLKQLDINFARYYFDALKAYVDGRETTPAWEMTFDFCKKNTSMPLIYLALGVNAHVNNDLGLSVFDVVKETEYKSEFDKVNPIIYNSIDEIIFEVKLSKFYKPFKKRLIYQWRTNAWNNYQNLKNKKHTKKEIEEKAANIALTLTKINSKKDFYYLTKILR